MVPPTRAERHGRYASRPSTLRRMYDLLRSGWMAVLLATLLVACAQPVATPAQPGLATAELTLTRSPTCACCKGHEAHLEQAGIAVRTVIDEDITTIKDDYRIPSEMRSCHTSEVAGYFVEGHVPVAAIARLLAERPEIDGIALPGMPAGSPGMGGTLDRPLVVFASADGEVVGEFGRF